MSRRLYSHLGGGVGVGIYFVFLRFLFIVLCKTSFLIWPLKESRRSDAWSSSVIVCAP